VVAQERLQERCDGRLLYRLKKPWTDGTTAIVLLPLDLLGRLAALVPPPRMHLLRYHAAFLAHANARSVVVLGSSLQELAPEQLRLPLISATCSTPHKAEKKQKAFSHSMGQHARGSRMYVYSNIAFHRL